MVWKRKRGVLPPKLRIAKASLYDPDFEYKKIQKLKREGKFASEKPKKMLWEMPEPTPPKEPVATVPKKPGRKKKTPQPNPIRIQTDITLSFS